MKLNFIKSKFVYIAAPLLIVIFCIPFLSGKYSNDSKIEEIAQFASEIVKNNTINSRYLTITIAPNDESGPVQDPYNEFHNLYGAFRQEQASFGSGVNFYDETKKDKEHDIYLKDYNDNTISSNLSMFYLGPVGSVEYKEHYKHFVYPFELMFVDNKNYDVSRYVAYISESHADKLLESLGELRGESGKYTDSQYKSLIRKKANMYIDGELHEYVINNIYYQSNYYYEAMSETFSDFILTSYFSPNKNALMSERKNIYFMNQYPYQNRYYMEYINKAYSSKLYDVSVNKNNVINDFENQNVLDFYYSTLNNPIINTFVILTVIYYLFLVICLISLIIFGFSFSPLPSLSLCICAFIPYLVFWIVFIITKSSLLFTKIAGINYFVGIVLTATTFIAWYFINRYVFGKRKKYESVS